MRSLHVTVETSAVVGDAAAGLELAGGARALVELDVCAAALRARAKRPNTRMGAMSGQLGV